MFSRRTATSRNGGGGDDEDDEDGWEYYYEEEEEEEMEEVEQLQKSGSNQIPVQAPPIQPVQKPVEHPQGIGYLKFELFR